MDREGKDPFDLLDELEQTLNIKVRPITWPVNMGSSFKGVYHMLEHQMNFFKINKTKLEGDVKKILLDSPELDKSVGDKDAAQLREDVEMIDAIYEEFDENRYKTGEVAPVFFGSAVNSFGIKELLDTFCDISPEPIARTTDVREVLPTEAKFSGFVFKIHANIDPRHRDRIAFLRICSGTFERGKFYKHVRLGKDMRFSNPYMFMADSKNVVDEGYPGDVVGLYDTGNFKIGDTLTEGEKLNYIGIPSFSPELFREVINTDPLKSKQLEKGVSQLAEEGVAQLFTMQPGNRKIIGTVGELQFEVIQHRLLNEYGASCRFESKPYSKACWITAADPEKLNDFIRLKSNYIAYDKDENPVFLAETDWILRMNKENNPDVIFHTSSDFKVAGV
jgi:peptide chain release factor 3